MLIVLALIMLVLLLLGYPMMVPLAVGTATQAVVARLPTRRLRRRARGGAGYSSAWRAVRGDACSG